MAAQNRSQGGKSSPLNPAADPLTISVDSTVIHLDIDDAADVDEDIDLDNDIDVDLDLNEIRREQEEALKDLREQMKQVKKELKNHTREVRRMKIVVNGDSTLLRNALRSARISLDSAERSLLQAHSRMMKFDVANGIGFAFSGDSSLAPRAMSRCTIVRSDSGAHRKMVIINGDTLPTAPRAFVFKRFGNGTDSSWSVAMPSMPSIPPIPALPPLPPMNFKFDTTGAFPFDGSRIIIINHDSLVVRDGEDEQTVIRIQNDSNGANLSTRVIIISTSRKGDGRPEAFQRFDTIGTPSSVAPNASESVEGYLLSENIPNPFNQTTTITFTLGKPGRTLLTVFDATGKVVKSLVDADLPAGRHTATLDATDLPSGIYLYRLVSGNFSQTRTMTLQK